MPCPLKPKRGPRIPVTAATADPRVSNSSSEASRSFLPRRHATQCTFTRRHRNGLCCHSGGSSKKAGGEALPLRTPFWNHSCFPPSSPPRPRHSLGTSWHLHEAQKVAAGPGDEGPAEGEGCKRLRQQPRGLGGKVRDGGAEGPSGNDSDDKE